MVFAVMLAAWASTYFLAREFTDWSPVNAALIGLAVGAFVSVAAAVALMTLRYQLIKRGIPSFLTRDAKQAHDEFMARMAADQKELGLDKESKAFAEKNVQEFGRLLRELETSPQYLKAGDAERQKMTEEMSAKHLKDTEAQVHEASARAVERMEALREYRELDERARRGESLSFEEKERMKRLKTKAYSRQLR